MSLPPDKNWPPLIEKGAVPPFIYVRDVVLTIIAWLVLALFLGDLFYYLYDYFSYPHFRYSKTRGPDWATIWLHLESFVYLAVFIVLFLIVWGFARRRTLRRIRDSVEPPVLSLEELLARRKMSPERLSELHAEKIVVVNFDADHQIVSAEGKPLPTGARETAPSLSDAP